MEAYMVFRGQGKGSSEESSRKPTSQFITKGRSGQGNKQLSAHNSTGLHSSTTSTGHDPNYNSRLSDDVQEEFRRLYAQLEELKERNMRLGNRHLVAKIAAMQEAADNILQTQAASQINGQSHVLLQQQLHQLSPGNNGCGGNSGGSCSGGSSSASTSGHSPSTKGKSPSAFGPLSDISEEENPLQSLSGHVQPFKGRVGPKVLETSIDIVIQSDSSRKTVSESGDNEQETNLNNGSCPPHGSMSGKKAMGKVEDSSNSNNTSFEGITKKDGVTENSSCQLTNTSTSDSAYNKLEEETTFAPDASTLLQDGVNDKKSPEVSIKEKGSAEPSSASPNLTKQGTPKSIAGVQVQDNIQSASSTSLQPSTATATGKRSPNTGKKQHRNKKSTPSASPSKQQGASGGESSKGKSEKHHQQPPTCQKSGAPAEEKAVNHKDGASGSSTGNGSGSSQKIILDLDDKSRFTEEITV
ncbi:unnamed protein product [Orchesella dallaii]|uniref:Uncharacterized protein n=1 Tax=Orchesella dallaii TaxID=48710 RepID=A0ABP1QFK3_9HEXA